ncbi:MAG: TylF/MycF family methyltransferase [Bacteroidales bacterium]|nr:TylF/MycF family methyltransferase [Bacteroidales bacterium]
MELSNRLYIDLLKLTLTDYHRITYPVFEPVKTGKKKSIRTKIILRYLKKRNLVICKRRLQDKELREIGKDYPLHADTMIGLRRLNNIEDCFKDILENNIEGDLIETGVWRGGATIFMKALLKANNCKNRNVWVADSFEGLPPPNEDKYKADKGDTHYLNDSLAISIDTVKENFKKYNLLDDKVKFLKGWFKDTLPKASIKKLALIRLDGDMYESTMDGLVNLYKKLSVGGFIIIDDYGAVEGCRKAVQDFRNEHGITEEIKEIDWTAVFWQKKKEI